MDWQTSTAAVACFAATNLDDILVLLVVFTQVRPIHVCMGQTLGFTIICAVSLVGIVLGLFIPGDYIRLLGFLPIFFGLFKLYVLCNETRHQPEIYNAQIVKGEPSSPPPPASQCGSSLSRDTILSFQSTTTVSELNPQDDTRSVEHSEGNGPLLGSLVHWCCASIMNQGTLKVALLTLANSSDNIGVYLPLFAGLSRVQLAGVLTIFYLMLVLWLVLAYALLARCAHMAHFLSVYGDRLVPFLLLGLGVFILSGSSVFDGFIVNFVG